MPHWQTDANEKRGGGLLEDQNDVASRLEKAFNVEAHPVALSGGVPAMRITLPYERYEEVKGWLTKNVGEPITKEPWHPHHTKEVPPLEFKLTPEMEFGKAAHINLISMMQQKRKRYVLLSWM